MVQDFEKLGVFYLGREYDLQSRQPKEALLLYDSRDLVTHAVCVGMTGSGKTGLCLALLEEAAIDGVPAVVIDPKGDLGNLLLTFPDLAPTDFRPWINEDDARTKGLDADAFAAQQAETWRQGLAGWGQDGARIKRLRDAAEFTIYTPGSSAGRPVSILKSFAAPPPEEADDREALRERIAAAATSVLGLLGIDADPMQSREHILLSNILSHSWAQGRDLDLAALIQLVQTPPFAKIGVLDLDAFYPAKERFELAMALNNLLASPGFEAWLEGDALDLKSILYTPQGKPRIAIFSIAHLGDTERMFFVSLLLNQTLSWMRAQPGTSSLRALLYMDEIFGYLPPVANPPSKKPLLTLLKQARAFGLGVVLATQNPVDLDYKGLANAGTWFIGRLQTERDKDRLLEGLEGAAGGSGMKFDREAMEQILAGLGSRVFLMNNVHDTAPVVFQTRWTLSYLRGPLTRTQIRQLSGARAPASPTAVLAAGVVAAPGSSPAPAARPAATAPNPAAVPPVVPPDVPQVFLPIRSSRPQNASLLYHPMLLGAAQAHYLEAKTRVDKTEELAYAAPLSASVVALDWDQALRVDVDPSELEREPAADARFADLPAPAAKARSYTSWTKEFVAWVFRTQKLTLYRSPSTGLISAPEESEGDFRIRLRQAVREERDRQQEKLRQKYAPKLSAIQDRLQRAEMTMEREREQASSESLNTAVAIGGTLLGALFGRRGLSTSRMGTAVRSASRASRQRGDVNRAYEQAESLRQQLSDLEAEFEHETGLLASKLDPTAEALESFEVRLKKTNITPRLVALAWAPHWTLPDGATDQAW